MASGYLRNLDGRLQRIVAVRIDTNRIGAWLDRIVIIEKCRVAVNYCPVFGRALPIVQGDLNLIVMIAFGI